MKQAGTVRRKIPQRTCVACRQTGNKSGLIRLVRQPNGEVVVDEIGRAPGRGAYLCRRVKCWEEAPAQLDHALKTHLLSEAKERLLALGREIAANEQWA